MVECITPAKRHGQRLLSGGATAVDGADGENVGEGRGNGCLKRLTPYPARGFWTDGPLRVGAVRRA